MNEKICHQHSVAQYLSIADFLPYLEVQNYILRNIYCVKMKTDRGYLGVILLKWNKDFSPSGNNNGIYNSQARINIAL